MDLRTKIFEADDGKSELVEVEEWGVKVEVRSMTGKRRAFMMTRFMGDGGLDTERLYPELLIATVYDPETGDMVFRPEDADALNERNAAALERIAQVALRLSGMTEKAQDDLGKDSSPTPSDGSTSS
jgi:hypothetical protein